MATIADQELVVAKVVDVLKALPLYGYKKSDVHYVDFPFEKKPPFGLLVSGMEEVEGDSLNETMDIGWPVQIVRCGSRLNTTDGLPSRSDWRRMVMRRFNRVRLGGIDCELVTRCSHGNLEIQDKWQSWNLDSSIMIVTVWTRQKHHGTLGNIPTLFQQSVTSQLAAEIIAPPSPPPDDGGEPSLLNENGDYVLLEDSSILLLD